MKEKEILDSVSELTDVAKTATPVADDIEQMRKRIDYLEAENNSLNEQLQNVRRWWSEEQENNCKLTEKMDALKKLINVILS